MIHEGRLDAKGFRFAIIVSRFNSFITDKLLEGALDALKRHGADDALIEIFRNSQVPARIACQEAEFLVHAAVPLRAPHQLITTLRVGLDWLAAVESPAGKNRKVQAHRWLAVGIQNLPGNCHCNCCRHP